MFSFFKMSKKKFSLHVSLFAFIALILGAIFSVGVPVQAQSKDVVVGPIVVDVRQGICPVKIESSDSALGGLVQRALKMHGAISMRTGGNVLAIRVERRGSSLVASCKAFPKEISVAGTTHAATLELCDKILAELGKCFGWELKPLFSKTKIAFAAGTNGKTEIYTSDLLFKETRRVTSHGSRSISPHWAPSGKRLLYTTYFKSGAPDVYSLDLATGVSTRFAAYKNSNTGGAFSPDGKTVALALSARGPMNIYLAPASGGSARVLVGDKDTSTSPTFSPDGKTIAFTSGAAGAPRLYTVPVAGGKKTRIAVPGFTYATEPAWNPVFPSKIAFCYNRYGKMAVAVYDLKTKSVFDVGAIAGGKRFSHPVWCADGRHLIVTEEVGKSTALAIVDAGNATVAKFTRINNPSSLPGACDPDTLISK